VLRNPEGIVIAAGAIFLVALAGFRLSAVWGDSREIVAKMEEVRALEGEVEKHDFPPPERNAEEHSERVIRAWEDLPPADTLNEWDFYVKPGRRR